MISTPPRPTLDVPGRRTVNLSDLFDRGEHYALLNAAIPRIEPSADSAPLALLACKSYVAVGLVGPAQELLTGESSPLRDMPEFDPVRDGLADVPSGRVAWAKLRRRFERHAEQLYRRHPHLEAHAALFRGIPDRFDLFQSRDGNVHVSPTPGGGLRRWRPMLFDARGLVNRTELPNDPKVVFQPPYLVTHDHHGLLFLKVFAATERMFLTYSPRIYVVEPDAATLGLALWLAEDISPWCHERVTISAGPQADQELRNHLLSHQDRQTPDYCVKMPFASEEAVRPILEALRDATVGNNEVALGCAERLRAHYGGLGADHWARRFVEADQKPLRILGLTSRFTTVLQYSMRDLRKAFERLGHTFETLIEPTDYDQPTAADWGRRIEAFRPDLIVVIDHQRTEYAQVIPPDVPYVCWVQDYLPHLTTEAAGRSMGPLDFYVAPDPDELARFYAYPRGRGLCRTLATNDRLYRAAPLPDEALQRHRCDFSFVSNHSTTPEAFHRKYLESYRHDPAAVQFIDALFDRMRRTAADDSAGTGFVTAGRLIGQTQAALGIAPGSVELRSHLCRTYIHPLSELFFRQSALEWVADYCDRTGRTLRLYGRGWEDHPRLAPYARGVIENGEPLRAIYQATTVNLQIIGSGAIHQRLLDGVAAGGFFLIRRASIDRVHEDCARLLAMVEELGIEAGRDYPCEDHPKLAQTVEALTVILGARPPSSAVTLSPEDLQTVRQALDAGPRRFAAAVFADYEQVSFGSRGEFEAAADRYLNDPEARRRVAAAMRNVVVSRYSYDALANDLLAFLRDRLSTAS